MISYHVITWQGLTLGLKGLLPVDAAQNSGRGRGRRHDPVDDDSLVVNEPLLLYGLMTLMVDKLWPQKTGIESP